MKFKFDPIPVQSDINLDLIEYIFYSAVHHGVIDLLSITNPVINLNF